MTTRHSDGLRWRIGVALGVAVLAVITTVFAAVGVVRHRAGEPVAQAPEVAPTMTAIVPRPVRPRTYPTYGEYVPAAPTPPVATRPGVLETRKRRARPSKSPDVRRCPSAWRDVPALVEWCKRNGYSTD